MTGSLPFGGTGELQPLKSKGNDIEHHAGLSCADWVFGKRFPSSSRFSGAAADQAALAPAGHQPDLLLLDRQTNTRPESCIGSNY